MVGCGIASIDGSATMHMLLVMAIMVPIMIPSHTVRDVPGVSLILVMAMA